MLSTFAGHINYVIVVVLMMLGLYVVFASGNLVKRLVGLGVFQTSVFLLYISFSKVAGGMPPILPSKKKSAAYGEGAQNASVAGPYRDQAVLEAVIEVADEPGSPAPAQSPDRLPEPEGEMTPQGYILIEEQGTDPSVVSAAAPDELASSLPQAAGNAAQDASGLADSVLQTAAYDAGLYSNPLPHVLILTAIVVGVATLAVGLALVVRIREAYGTIEDDDISADEYNLEVVGGDA
jgi:multicomponent Na+:H+ antiporter subunit C